MKMAKNLWEAESYMANHMGDWRPVDELMFMSRSIVGGVRGISYLVYEDQSTMGVPDRILVPLAQVRA